jgi:hypothetical protein
VTINLRLYVGKSGNNVVVKIYPQWSYHVRVPWPTSWFVDASTIGNAVKGVITPMLGTTVSTTAVPWNVLSVKVEPNGDLNTYTQD